jgi:hypothetical protein
LAFQTASEETSLTGAQRSALGKDEQRRRDDRTKVSFFLLAKDFLQPQSQQPFFNMLTKSSRQHVLASFWSSGRPAGNSYFFGQ